ncbi:DNA-binding PadR family transcriptional regulator [Diaminobutyricimonas aerilata]|uniref:DNA-binding PadR family transcriptional regulator n=1 Tax=Diaminobutyricimonas aerilata TaxID=1162967 RepID=A0A2M9CG39_9MICO|nr:PadR family transcriptional regulator [Diaminobutyricimonas aerilata]PJJ70906.1 DNA-binding PadR family transcriptional regulator [Diaminobutyricimonas aerilata]
MNTHEHHRHHENDHDGHQHDGGRFRHGFALRGPHGHGRGGRGPGFGPGAGFGPGFGPRGGQRAGRGDVRSAILSLLADGPSNGYGLIKAIAEKTAGAWRPSPGSVYPTLQQLVDEELIVSSGDGRRTQFDLTEAGRAYVEENKEQLDRAWQAVAGATEEDAEFHASVGKLMGVVQQFRFAATPEQRAAATEKLDETRRALYLILAD